MIRNAIHTFDNAASTGIGKVPVFGIVHIEDFNGRPRFVQKLGVVSSGTIQDFINDTSMWKEVSKDKLGALYDSTELYKVGDIVTHSGIIYICNTDIQPSTFDPNKWDNVNGNEIGGVTWDSTVNYTLGDLVTDKGSIYLALSDSFNLSPRGHPTYWGMFSSGGERGGIAYSNITDYTVGDLVTDINEIGSFYVSINTPNINNPLSDSLYWVLSADAQYYNAHTGGDKNGDGVLDNIDDSGAGTGMGGVLHCPWDSTSGDPLYTPVTPNTIGEYPNTTLNPEKEGANWYIDGLGKDDHGNSIQYLMVTGNLIGIGVADGDKLTWVGGVHGAEVWMITPRPRVIGERGGLQWRSGETYSQGDTVTEGVDNITFTATAQQPLVSITPSLNPSDWKSVEKGGELWRNSVKYDVGDTVWDNLGSSLTDVTISGLWICTTPHISDDTTGTAGRPSTPTSTNWTDSILIDPGTF